MSGLKTITPMAESARMARQSNFELLRIVAMLLVLIIHADFYSINWPTHDQTLVHPVASMMRYLVESLALVCVNVYIIVSGYFGIRLKARSILAFLFMILFWRLLINIGFLGAGTLGLDVPHLTAGRFLRLCVPGYDDWFVSAYIMLMIMSPVLNYFIRRADLRWLWTIVVVYEGLQALTEWRCFSSGYSALSFVGLYLLGAAVRRTRREIVRSPFACYFGVSAVAALLAFAARRWAPDAAWTPDVDLRFVSLNGPLVLAASTFLFVGFKRLKFTSHAVNYIAPSSFAVYLMHMHPLIRDSYARACSYLYENFSTWPYIALICAFIAGVFITAVAVDLLRRWLWSRIAASTTFEKAIAAVSRRLARG